MLSQHHRAVCSLAAMLVLAVATAACGIKGPLTPAPKPANEPVKDPGKPPAAAKL